MTELRTSERERAKIRELAERYIADDYEVFADLAHYERPEPIEGFIPDLVAVKNDSMIIVEVKTSRSIKEQKSVIETLAKYAEKVPGVRFDLVVTNPRPQSSPRFMTKLYREELDLIETGLLRDIKATLKIERVDLAMVLANRLLEGLLLRIARKRGVSIGPREKTTHALANRLANEGIISRSVQEFANEVRRLRNAAVHGDAIASTELATEVYDKLVVLFRDW